MKRALCGLVRGPALGGSAPANSHYRFSRESPRHSRARKKTLLLSRRVGPIMLSDRPQGAGIDRCGPTVTGRNVDLPLLVETSVTALRYSDLLRCRTRNLLDIVRIRVYLQIRAYGGAHDRARMRARARARAWQRVWRRLFSPPPWRRVLERRVLERRVHPWHGP